MIDIATVADAIEQHLALNFPRSIDELVQALAGGKDGLRREDILRGLNQLTSTGRAVPLHCWRGPTRYQLPEPAAPVDITLFPVGMDVPAFLAKPDAHPR